MATADRIKFIQPGEGIPQPGTCSVCGFSDWQARRCITFGVKIKYYGHFLLCETCLNTVLTQPELRYVPREELELSEKEAAVYRDRVIPTIDVVNSLRSDIDTLIDSRLGTVYGYGKRTGREDFTEDSAVGEQSSSSQIGFFDEQLAESESEVDQPVGS
jgi:hypothetical protein